MQLSFAGAHCNAEHFSGFLVRVAVNAREYQRVPRAGRLFTDRRLEVAFGPCVVLARTTQ